MEIRYWKPLGFPCYSGQTKVPVWKLCVNMAMPESEVGKQQKTGQLYREFKRLPEMVFAFLLTSYIDFKPTLKNFRETELNTESIHTSVYWGFAAEKVVKK